MSPWKTEKVSTLNYNYSHDIKKKQMVRDERKVLVLPNTYSVFTSTSNYGQSFIQQESGPWRLINKQNILNVKYLTSLDINDQQIVIDKANEENKANPRLVAY